MLRVMCQISLAIQPAPVHVSNRIQNMGGMSQRIALDLIYKDITNSSELVESFVSDAFTNIMLFNRIFISKYFLRVTSDI